METVDSGCGRRHTPASVPAPPRPGLMREWGGMDTMTGTAPINGAGTQGGREARGDLRHQGDAMQTPYPDRDPIREDRMVGLLEALHGIRAPELEPMLAEVAAHVAAA